MNTPHVRRLHFPEGELPAGGKVRGVCHCGYTTTPRVDSKRAHVRIGDVIAGRRVLAVPPYPNPRNLVFWRNRRSDTRNGKAVVGTASDVAAPG